MPSCPSTMIATSSTILPFSGRRRGQPPERLNLCPWRPTRARDGSTEQTTARSLAGRTARATIMPPVTISTLSPSYARQHHAQRRLSSLGLRRAEGQRGLAPLREGRRERRPGDHRRWLEPRDKGDVIAAKTTPADRRLQGAGAYSSGPLHDRIHRSSHQTSGSGIMLPYRPEDSSDGRACSGQGGFR